jgi:hypothetical protein
MEVLQHCEAVRVGVPMRRTALLSIIGLVRQARAGSLVRPGTGDQTLWVSRLPLNGAPNRGANMRTLNRRASSGTADGRSQTIAIPVGVAAAS